MTIGQRIIHDNFGYGRITEIDRAELTVAFEKARVKEVVESLIQRV